MLKPPLYHRLPGLLFLSLLSFAALLQAAFTQPVPREHPYLLGDAAHLKQLAVERTEDWNRVYEVITQREGGDHERMLGCGLLYVIEGDQSRGREAIERAMIFVNAPIWQGHVRFADILANCALVYDLCYPLWTAEEKRQFIEYFNATVDANVQSETSPFHNAWYSYKHWGYGLAALATWHDNPRAREIWETMDRDYRERALACHRLAGKGGGWAEGFYTNYWTYEWMFFCDVARRVVGEDYIGMSPEFLGNRAVAGMFETYPGIGPHQSRRQVPMGDGDGKIPGNDRDKTLNARRILVSRFRNDPTHQVVNAFNEQTPQSCMVDNAYKDFLWRDPAVPQGDLKSFKLSHLSPGAGFVYARSSWEDDATYFFFKCGDRFTAHQHLDLGHFIIYKHEELAGDGGQYAGFGDEHDVNYYLRTIAHSTILVHDPAEQWTNLRAYKGPIGNDGGQHHDWPHHNGSVLDAAEWEKGREMFDIADLLAFEDTGDYLYVAGDCSRAYRRAKLEEFTRQIVFIRPGTFVIFDRVRSTKPEYRKSWQLQAMQAPERREDGTLVVTNGRGRLFVQPLLPRAAELKLHTGEELYSYGGASYPPSMVMGPLPECRVEFSPAAPARQDYFLHVLTATDSTVERVPVAELRENDREVMVSVAGTRLAFLKAEVGGRIGREGRERELSRRVIGN